jgi:mannan endo-1,4-beta-mannosidase
MPPMSPERTTARWYRQTSGLTVNRRSWSPPRYLPRTQIQVKPTPPRSSRRTATWVGVVTCAALVIGAAVSVAFTVLSGPQQLGSPTQSMRYLGVYERGFPSSYTGVTTFTAVTGVRPDVLMYYSAWQKPFQVDFATTAAEHGAVPLVQINPTGVSLAAIASGQYDSYLSAYAEAVRSYRRPVILSFGHEMNGDWYSWSYRHTSPAVFVAAWRHIVKLFRGLGVRNVTWLWTINIIDRLGGISSPAAWWPGSSYVTWVGIDGYYFSPSEMFASLFGPTIVAVRALTHDPILISETGAAPATGQSAKIADLFAGVRLYGLLGFVWFDAKDIKDWRLSRPAVIGPFRRYAQMYYRPAS